MPEPTDQQAKTTERAAKPDDTDDPARTKDAAAPGEATANNTPHTLGPYRILKELGRGAMGVVYHAHHDFLHGDVALKVMDRSILADPTAKERFLREARAAFKLRHENVVEVYDAAEINGEPYIAMQLLAGVPLDKRLKDGPPVPLPEALRIVRQTALGLSAVHALGMIHRDLKPANLWLEAPTGRVKVLDFGLVKQAGDKTLTRINSALGTPLYMSPEQANSKPVDARSDLFSLGSVFYELCTGAPPFTGDGPLDVMFAIYTKEPRPVRAANPTVPVPVADLIHALLVKDPAKRVQTALALVERIVSIEAGRAPVAVPPPPPPPPAPSARDRLSTGRVTIDELLALKTSGTAESDLWLYSAQIWPIVKAAALGRADVRDAFRLLLAAPDNVRELWNEAVTALRAGDANAMGNWLNVVRETAGAERVFELLTDFYDTPECRVLPLAGRELLHSARELYARFAGTPAPHAAEPDLLDELLKPDPEPDPDPEPEPEPEPELPPPPPRSPLQRLRRGDNVTIGELLELKDDPLAAYDLRARADAVFAVVKQHLSGSNVRAAFRDLLSKPENLRAIWVDAVAALLEESFRRWDAGWAAVREFGGADDAKAKLAKFIGDKNEDKVGKLPTDVRAKMRAACADVQLFPPRALLVPLGLGEVEPLLTSSPDQAGYTAFVILAPDSYGWLNHVPLPNRATMRQRAKEYLYSAPIAALAAYVRAAREYLNTDTHFLDVLFKPYSAPAAALLSRVLVADILEPTDWRNLCDSANLAQNEWGEFLLKNDHLSALLVGLGGEGTGRDVWQGYLESLSPALVSSALIETTDVEPGVVTAWERTVHAQLKLAAEKLNASGHRLVHALEVENVRRLFAANNLVKWVTDPATAERDGTPEVHHACETFGMKPYDLVRAAFVEGRYGALELPRELPKLEPLMVLFRTAYPTHPFHGARSAVTYWLKLSHEFPLPGRAAFQSEFVLMCVPDQFHRDLLADKSYRVPFEPVAVARIMQAISNKAKPAARKAQRPAPLEPQFADEQLVFEEGDDERPAEQPPARSHERKYKSARGRAGGNGWVPIVTAAIAIVVLVVAALRILR